MPRTADRFVCSVPAEVVVAGVRYRASIEDVSRGGLFLRLPEVAVVPGAELRVAMEHDGRVLTAAAIVAHRLAEPDALALGRQAGVGVALRPPVTAADELFAIAIERLIRESRAAAPLGLHAVVGDPNRVVAERTARALGEVGFSVATASSGLEALAACLRRTPDVVVIDRAMPVLDGYRLIDLLARAPAACGVPVVITSQYADDLPEAFERGARDFLVKPFATAELVARVRRLARHERPALRGSLTALPLSSLLSLFEHERTTGRLVLPGAWIDLRAGRIVDASTGDHSGLPAVHALLDRPDDGQFELVAATPAGELELSIMHVLLDHARRRDEAA